MKIIVGVFDRQISRRLSIVFSGKKVFPVEAESIEEIPALLSRHEGAVLLTEETDPDFHLNIKKMFPLTEIFLLCHSTLSIENMSTLRTSGLRGVIPYTEEVEIIADTLMKYLALMVESVKKEEPSLKPPYSTMSYDVLICVNNHQVYGNLLGFNSSKIAVNINDPTFSMFLRNKDAKVSIYLQGLQIKAKAEILYSQKKTHIFRYCSMTKDSQEKLSYYIHYCRLFQEDTASIPLSV